MKSDAKRGAITEIALEAFAELGYERTSMLEISGGVGGSKATLYRYFESPSLSFSIPIGSPR